MLFQKKSIGGDFEMLWVVPKKYFAVRSLNPDLGFKTFANCDCLIYILL